MSHITEETVDKIATLARLYLTAAEKAKAAADLTKVLDNFSVIQEIDTTTVPPASDVTGLQNVTREDKAAPETLATHDELLKRVPSIQGRHIKVKAAL